MPSGSPGALGDLDASSCEPAPHDLELDVGLVGEQLPLDHVAGHLAVDDLDTVADQHARGRGRRAGRDSDDSRRGHPPRIRADLPCIVEWTWIACSSPRPEASAPGSRWRSRRSRGWCGPSSRPCTATTRSSTTSSSSIASPRSAWSSSTMSTRCPKVRPLMLSAHGSAPEVVAAARKTGGYVVDSVCPLVTKVHHEVQVRAGKGYRIVYVGHEGHEEAVGTMAVAPDAMHRVESVDDVARPSRPSPSPSRSSPRRRSRTATGPACSTRHASGGPSLWMPGRSDLCFATTNRQSALMAMAPRCDAIVVIGSANSSNTRALEKLAIEAGCPSVHRVNSRRRASRRAARRRRRHGRRVGAGGARRRRDRAPRPACRASRRSASPTRTSTSRRRATSATCRPRSRSPRPSLRVGRLPPGPRSTTERIAASDVLGALRA